MTSMSHLSGASPRRNGAYSPASPPPAPAIGNGDIYEDEVSIQALETHRLECEREGRYGEAESSRLRLKALTSAEQDRRREDLRSQQLEERMSVEDAHMRELESFNTTWDSKVSEFETHAVNLRSALEERFRQEHGLYVEKLNAETDPKTPRWSADLLQYRKVQQTLGKQKQYAEAQKIQFIADKQEAKEQASWQNNRQKKIKVQEDQFIGKQRSELKGLLKRIQSGRDEQTQARKLELNRLLQRYLNVKSQLETQQKIIMQRVEKYPVGVADARPKSAKPNSLSPMPSHSGLIGA